MDGPLEQSEEAQVFGRAGDPPRRVWVVFVCFFLSGFTGLLYQTIWMRLALGGFGVNSAVVATVLTVFMLGLALGTVLAGRWTEAIERRLSWRGLQTYAAAECTVALGGCLVPILLGRGRAVLLAAGASTSVTYTLASTLLIAVALLPFCIAMGATFPAALSYLKRAAGTSRRSYAFSYLYLANVSGALLGVLLTSLVLIEVFGFRASGYIGALVNVLIVILALSVVPAAAAGHPSTPRTQSAPPTPADTVALARLTALFLTGFSALGMEVVWARLYPYFIGTFVYSFAIILATYLVATTIGSLLYRRRLLTRRTASPWSCWHWLCVTSVLPLLSASVRFEAPGPLRVIFGLGPFCTILGFLTPFLLDEHAGNDPARAGRAYGLNLLGCVLGPLLAGFVLIPAVGQRNALLLLAAPLFLFLLAAPVRTIRRAWTLGAVFAGALAVWAGTTTFEDQFPKEQVRFDHTATVVASGEGIHKRLFVNGVGMTTLTPITKMMVHFPMAHLDAPVATRIDGLVVCLGMGTSFRSLASWGGNTTVVELVPSVPTFLTYYFPDAAGLLTATDRTVRIEVDDGRRFLDRTEQRFDLITVDPPPPVQASGTSLLYSKEFFASARQRLKPKGILQVWLPWGDKETVAGVTLSLLDSFPHVRVFKSVEGWGYHYLASAAVIPSLSAEQLLSHMPAAAVRDMTEWDDTLPLEYFQKMVAGEVNPLQLLLLSQPGGGTILTDDRPVNEFFFVRRFLRAKRSDS